MIRRNKTYGLGCTPFFFSNAASLFLGEVQGRSPASPLSISWAWSWCHGRHFLMGPLRGVWGESGTGSELSCSWMLLCFLLWMFRYLNPVSVFSKPSLKGMDSFYTSEVYISLQFFFTLEDFLFFYDLEQVHLNPGSILKSTFSP